MFQRLNRAFGRVRKGRKNESGATAIEFAFIAPVFLFLLLGIVETGFMLFSEYIIENGTAQAARKIRTGQAQTGGFSKVDFKNEVCGSMASFLNCQNKLYVDVRRYASFNAAAVGGGTTGSGDLDGGVTANSAWDPGQPNEVVVVRTYYEFELFTPMLNWILYVQSLKSSGQSAPTSDNYMANMNDDKRLIRGTAVFRNEPFATN